MPSQVVDPDDHVDLGIESAGPEHREIGTSSEAEPIDVGFEGGEGRVELADPAIVVGDAASQLGPLVRTARDLQAHGDSPAWRAVCRVKDVCRDRAQG